MRRNAFGEAYCHTLEEVRAEIESGEAGWEVYISHIDAPEPGEANQNFVGEILTNAGGEVVCYIEAPCRECVQQIAHEAKLDGADNV